MSNRMLKSAAASEHRSGDRRGCGARGLPATVSASARRAGSLGGAALASGGNAVYFTGYVNGIPGVFKTTGNGAASVVFQNDVAISPNRPLVQPTGVAISADEQTLYVADLGSDGYLAGGGRND